VAASQDMIYSFLLEIVKSWQPDRVVEHFKNLFIYNLDSPQVPCCHALQDILINNDETVFLQTIKRCCYILINNWDHVQKGAYIRDLVESFEDPSIHRYALGDMTQRLRGWLRLFIESPDYQSLQLFARRFEEKKKSWSDRYAHYQLINQAEDPTNSSEQREAARTLTTQVRNRFRLDLALYVSHSQSSPLPSESIPIASKTQRENPTGLGETTVNLIKSLVMHKGFFGPDNLARIFLDQIQNLSYADYKASLLNYLTYSSTEQEKKEKKGFAHLLKHRLNDRLSQLYLDKDSEEIRPYLMLRTCNQIISFLITENNQDPSHAFILFVSQGHSLLLAIVLLKIILISPDSRSHLDLRIAKLVQYYIRLHQEKDLEESHYFGYFLDIINVTLAIYTEGVRYNVIPSKDFQEHDRSRGQRQSDRKTVEKIGNTLGDQMADQAEPIGDSFGDQSRGSQVGESEGDGGKQKIIPLQGYRIFAQSQKSSQTPSQIPSKSEAAVSEPPVALATQPAATPPTLKPTSKPNSKPTILYDAVTGEEIIFAEDPLSL